MKAANLAATAKQLTQSIVNDPQALGHLNWSALSRRERCSGCSRAGFTRVKSAVVSGFQFRKQSTQSSAEAYGVKAVLFTAEKPA